VLSDEPGRESARPRELVEAKIAGFRHSASRSAFRLGDGRREDHTNGFQRVVGSEGVIAIADGTGGFQAIPNAGAPSRRRPGLFQTGNEHNAYAKDYFVDAGLPQNQIAQVLTHTEMSSAGEVDQLHRTTHPDNIQLLRFVTRITRQVEGIAVPDSYAWTTFDDRAEASAEDVHWPELAPRALQEAQHIQGSIDRLTALATAALRETPTNVEVAIHHSDWTDRNIWSTASLDVTVRVLATAVTHHFDRDGREFRLPSE
jgi:hypothetical protein